MTQFKVLQIGNVDITGSRFNGQDLHVALSQKGFKSHHLVWKKLGSQVDTSELQYAFKTELKAVISNIEMFLAN